MTQKGVEMAYHVDLLPNYIQLFDINDKRLHHVPLQKLRRLQVKHNPVPPGCDGRDIDGALTIQD